MTWLAPAWLAVAALAAAGAIALHFIATARAPESPLPTARFVPAGTASAAARARRPADLLLLALRVLALALLGAAFAGPLFVRPGATLRRVVVADASRSSASDVRDSVRAWWRAGDALVTVDSSARTVGDGRAALETLAPTGARGSLSAGLAAALPAARTLVRGADSVELVVVTPLTGDELDSATVPLARAWPGRVRFVRTRAAPVVWPIVAPGAREATDDALAATAALITAEAPRGAATMAVRLVEVVARADSEAARSGAAIVAWPRAGGETAVARGVTDGRATVVAPLIERAVPAGVVIARWADGAPAAVESPLGRGCVRSVGVIVPAPGDVSLQAPFVALARTLMGPCVSRGAWPAAGEALVRGLAHDGAAASPAALRAAGSGSPLTPWLLAAALAVLVVESWLRRRPVVAA
ncbi:MAG: BatA domain-containing protein [Gemmatimonadetes bacterium]|nr:BatA domain-containing protein [Gemmatimonadota bacterium]